MSRDSHTDSDSENLYESIEEGAVGGPPPTPASTHPTTTATKRSTRSADSAPSVYLSLSNKDVCINGQWCSPAEAAALLGWPSGVKHVLPVEQVCGPANTRPQTTADSTTPDAVQLHQTPNKEGVYVPRGADGQSDLSKGTPISLKASRHRLREEVWSDPTRPTASISATSGAARSLFTSEEPPNPLGGTASDTTGAQSPAPANAPQQPELPSLILENAPSVIMPDDNPQQGAVRWPNLKLPAYGGTNEEFVENYFDKVDSMATIYGWQAPQKLAMAMHGLTGRAADWVKTLPADDKNEYEALKKKMKDIFGDKRPTWQRHKDMFTYKQQRSQSALEYAGILRQQQARTSVTDEVLLAVFIDGLEGSVGRQLAIQNPDDFEAAVRIASRLESVDKPKRTVAAMDMARKQPSHEQKIHTGEENHGREGASGVQELVGAFLAAMATSTDQGRQDNKRQWSARPQRDYQGTGQMGSRGNRGYAPPSGPRPSYDQARQKRAEDGTPYCIVHEVYGHPTDSCNWLKGKLKDIKPT